MGLNNYCTKVRNEREPIFHEKNPPRSKGVGISESERSARLSNQTSRTSEFCVFYDFSMEAKLRILALAPS